jgi:serine/threonine protein kinase
MSFPTSNAAKQRFSQIELITPGTGTSPINVYRAYDKDARRWVAVKEVVESLPLETRLKLIRRMEHEAEFGDRIDNYYKHQMPDSEEVVQRTIVTVYGSVPAQLANEIYLVSEYLDMGTLADILQTRKQLNEYEAALVARDIARAVEVHWANNIVHLDIKPSNIFVVRSKAQGIIGSKLGDYSMAQDVTKTPVDVSKIDLTPAYTAPELLEGKGRLHAELDLYSIGLILWEMLHGASRYRSSIMPISSETLNGASPSIVEVVQRALNNNAKERYTDPSDLVRDLNQAVVAISTSAKQAVPGRAWLKLARRHWPLVAAVCVLLLIVIVWGINNGVTASTNLANRATAQAQGTRVADQIAMAAGATAQRQLTTVAQTNTAKTTIAQAASVLATTQTAVALQSTATMSAGATSTIQAVTATAALFQTSTAVAEALVLAQMTIAAAAQTATVAALPTSTPTSIPVPTPVPQLRVMRVRQDEAPTCILVQIRGIPTENWTLRANGITLPPAPFDSSGNARLCGFRARREFTFNIYNAEGGIVPGGEGIKAGGGDVFTGDWQ